MASYVAPDEEEIRDLTGVRAAMDGPLEDDLAGFDALLLVMRARAEQITSARITRAAFIASTHTEDTAGAIAIAVAHRVAAFAYRRFAGQFGTGTNAPNRGSSAECIALSMHHAQQARELELLVMGEKYRERAILEPQS